MSTHAFRLSRLFTPEYARRINAQIVHPASSTVVKPNELQSALARPVNVSVYEPHRDAAYFAATLSYGMMNGHPFMDGNKRTAFFIANEYLRAQGHPGLARNEESDDTRIADRHIDAAAGKLGVQELADAMNAESSTS